VPVEEQSKQYQVGERNQVMAIELQALRGIPEFSALADAELAYVQKVTRERQIQRGELLFLEGGPGERLYYLEQGRITILNRSLLEAASTR
jgi:CRP/FNR family cyclic AMP-dependent transcriptional regulator